MASASAGANRGAVVNGHHPHAPGLGPAFLLPAVALAAVLFAVPRFRERGDAASKPGRQNPSSSGSQSLI